MKRLILMISILAIISSVLLTGCNAGIVPGSSAQGSFVPDNSAQGSFVPDGESRESNTQQAENTSSSSPEVRKSQTSAGALEGYEKYPWSFSIFVACAYRELPHEWMELKAILASLGYEFWFPYEEDVDGWMLFPNSNDELEFYTDYIILFGGLSEDSKTVTSLMYQFNYNADYIMVKFYDDGDRYFIYKDKTEVEVSTLDEILAFAVAALDEIYGDDFTN